ncbi:MAG: SGNH/GDSL hydrolase family protein [Candidatus Lernaella stagnicola]|nr:SGNH/GDSL hydrolase family protein [Candidatus Lernaella stagnicola]
MLFELTNIYGQHDRAKFIKNKGTQYPTDSPRPRVICLGSSSTYGAGLEDIQDAFPGVLQQQHPEWDVINAGCGGHVAYQLSIYLREVLMRLKPKVVVLYYGGNESFGASTKSFYPRAQQIVAAMRARGDDSLGELESAVSHGTANRIGLALYQALDRSQAFLWWRDRVLQARREADLLADVADVESFRIPPTPREILAGMAEATRAGGATLILMPEIDSGTRHAHDTTTAAMRETAAQENVLFVDPLAVLNDPALFLDTTHLTPEGHQTFAAFLDKRLSELMTEENQSSP